MQTKKMQKEYTNIKIWKLGFEN